MLTMIFMAAAITAFLVLAYRWVHRPRIKEVPLTDEERAEIEAALAPFLETIKKRIDEDEDR